MTVSVGGSGASNALPNTSRRRSVFYEQLTDDETPAQTKRSTRPSRVLRFNSKPDVLEYDNSEDSDSDYKSLDSDLAEENSTSVADETVPAHTMTRAEYEGSPVLYRLGAAALIVAASIPLFQGAPWFGSASVPAVGVGGGVIRREPNPVLDVQHEFVRRDDSPTAVCTRWAHMSALVNGTLYVYGGQATTEPGQSDNTWNNDFLAFDVTSSWQTSNPLLTGLPQPSGPPNVSLGALWNSYDSLYLYGGEYSSAPPAEPAAFAMWEYDLLTSSWIEHSDPTTSSGTNSGANEQAVQQAAEGAGLSVPSLGRGYYFGGHQDAFTTQGWSQSTWRIYLQSLLEFTMPGYENNQITALSGNKAAGTDGNWRNITQGGDQSTAGFPERADGLLLYVPGFGANGILIGLAGGTNTTLQQLNTIDVFDIATSTWYKQSTSGSTPEIRVDPCAVVAAAPDGSSYNVFMFGGQNLQPAGNQTLYDDMWILTIPSFTWIQVDQSSQSVPAARAGHTCNIWDGQMVVVGGYVGADISCDSPGIYVFDLSSLKWVLQFTASSAGSASSSGTSVSSSSTTSGSKASASTFVSNGQTNPFNQQPAQLANASSPGGLEGSYGYQVAAPIISVIGGASTGGATITTPSLTATDGPLKTGKPVTYTVTQSNGAVVTETGTAGSNSGSGSSSSSNDGKSGPNIAAIVAGTIAGLLLLVVCYLLFCTWLYRKQLQLYRRHVEMTQRAHENGEKDPVLGRAGGAAGGFLGGLNSEKSSSDRRRGEGLFGMGPKLSSEVSQTGSGSGATGVTGGSSRGGASGNGANGYESLRRNSSGGNSVEDLLGGSEPTLWSTVLAPRRSLRIVNRD